MEASFGLAFASLNVLMSSAAFIQHTLSPLLTIYSSVPSQKEEIPAASSRVEQYEAGWRYLLNLSKVLLALLLRVDELKSEWTGRSEVFLLSYPIV